MGRNEVAGVVHGREFVMDANATSRIGVDNLKALQQGKMSAGQAAASQPSTSPQPTAQASESGGSNVRIINVIDPAMVGDYASTPEGEETFVNVMRKNSDEIKRIVNT